MKRENLTLLLYGRILILNGRPISAEIAPFPLYGHVFWEYNKGVAQGYEIVSTKKGGWEIGSLKNIINSWNSQIKPISDKKKLGRFDQKSWAVLDWAVSDLGRFDYNSTHCGHIP